MNSDLQNKLQQFSADPPKGVWNKIADALDAEEGFAQRLYQYEETPPALNWQKIEEQLDTQPEPVKVVSVNRRFTKPMRYIAAACLAAITLVTITLVTNRTESGALDGSSTPAVPAANVPVTVAAGSSQTDQNQGSGTVLQPVQKGDKHSTLGSPSRSASSNHSRRTINTTPANAALTKYVTYSDGNGKVVKVSRKMENYINCENNDWQCKQRLQQLRQKMAAKAMTTDFTGILEMLQQLQ